MSEEVIPSNSEPQQNGLTNGTNGVNGSSEKQLDTPKSEHKSSRKDKEHRHSSSHKSSHKDSHRDKDKHKSSSSSSSDKHKSSSSDKHKSSSSDKHKSSSSDKHKSSSSSDKHKSSSSDKHKSSSSGDKHKSSSSSGDKHKSSSSSDKHKSSSSSSSKDKDRHKSSSDKSKSDKDKKSSDKDKHRDKDAERSKDKHRSSSSSSKHKSSSKDKDKHRSSSKSSHRDKERDSEKDIKKELEIKEEQPSIEEKEDSIVEDQQPQANVLVKDEMEDVESSVNETFNNTNDENVPEESEGEEDNEVEEQHENHVEVKEERRDNRSQNSSVKYKEESDEEGDESALNINECDSGEEFKPEEEKNEESEDDVPLASRQPKREMKQEESDDDMPLASRKKAKKEEESDDEVPLAARRKSGGAAKKRKKKASSSDDEEDFKPAKKAKTKAKPKTTPVRKAPAGAKGTPTKKVKKETEEEKNVWKWWEEEKSADGRKWTFLEHKGVVFAEPYIPLPPEVYMKYDGKECKLSEEAEEVSGFYARMIEHDYVTKKVFNDNFFRDFRKVMTEKERAKIVDLTKCDFRKIHAWYASKSEERKARSKEEKNIEKEKNAALITEYGWCTIDGHKQKIGNFRAEPPSLFRGRGEHPKMGKLKKRLMPEEVIINCAKDSVIPVPPAGHKWKEVRHDNQVTWLASWTENVQGQTKYVMMNASSKLKSEKDWQKYETARRLHQIVDKVRDQYIGDWKSKEMRLRQRAVALYFIDKLALRAGNEKDEDSADTVGCCSLRVEHITLYDEKDGKQCVVAFDFLGKDSIRYYNEVPVEKRVFKNLGLFMDNKAPGDDLFDRLNTTIMNKHLSDIMPGLTAKVFRTYNASITLQLQLTKLTDPEDDIPQKVLSYNRANREVAILCNHQRAVPKTFDKSMENLKKKIDDKEVLIEEAEKDLKNLKRASSGSVTQKVNYQKKTKQVERLKDQLHKLNIQSTDREENKQIALGTSKLNYLDPRITVAWVKKHDVPMEKVYNKTLKLKFQWAIEMVDETYDFTEPPTSLVVNTSQNDDDDGEEEEEE